MERCQKLKQKQVNELRETIKTSKKADEVKRAQAIIMIDGNVSNETITAMTGYQRRQAYGLRKKYLKSGISSIVDRRKGKPKELLTRKQREEIIETVKTKAPKDVGYAHEHWTSGLLGDYIETKYGVKYKSKTSLYLIFRKSSFTYHKPGRKYHLRDEREVAEFRRKAKETLGKAWKEKDTIVLCEDEMILSTQTTFQKIWLPRNEYPRIEISNNRKNRSVYGFLNAKTGTEHAWKTEYQNMFITKNILKELRKIYPTEKLLIFWDRAGWHHGSVVQEFIKQDKNIETVYFPRYSPEENPQEHVWKNGRSAVTHNAFINDIDTTTNTFTKYLNATKFRYSLLGFSAGL